jgi:hypothetical protein
VQILGEQGLAHARNTGSLLQQEKTLGQHEKHHEKIVDWLKIENEYALEAQRIWNENAKIISGLARQGIDALFPTSELARIEAMLEAIARIKMPDTFGGLGSLASNLAEFSFQQMQAAGTAGFKFDAEQAKSIQLMPRDQALADLQKYSDQLDALNRLWPEGSRDSELYQMKLYGLNDSIRQATIAADPFLQSIERIATEFGDQANQALKSALLDPKNTGEYAKQFAQAILGDIYDELIGNQLKKSITSGIESLFGIAPNERPTGALGSPLHVVVDAGLPGVTQSGSGGLLGGLGNLFGLSRRRHLALDQSAFDAAMYNHRLYSRRWQTADRLSPVGHISSARTVRKSSGPASAAPSFRTATAAAWSCTSMHAAPSAVSVRRLRR